MESAGFDQSALRTLHTNIPFRWRRNLVLLRVLLGAAGVLLYLILPIHFSELYVIPMGIYTLWSGWLAVRDPMWSLENPMFQLALDVALFLGIAVHPSEAGMWLAGISWFYVLTVAALLYHWHIVLALVAMSAGFLAIFRPLSALRLWPAVLFGGAMASVIAVQRRSMEDRLSGALRRSVLSRMEAELAREQERQRIGGDFHDGPLQSFIGVQLRLEIIRQLRSRDPEQALQEVLQLQDLGRIQVTELRSFVRSMQPAEVTPGTLGSAIREAVEHFERDSGISAELFCGDLSSLDETVVTDVLQIVREALNNVRKHSKASRLRMEVDIEARELSICVDDDGSGFPFSGNYNLDELEALRLGPRSIKRRVRTLGGELLIESRPTEGATVKIRIPTRS
jgi:signal transduction histidine kinase